MRSASIRLLSRLHREFFMVLVLVIGVSARGRFPPSRRHAFSSEAGVAGQPDSPDRKLVCNDASGTLGLSCRLIPFWRKSFLHIHRPS